MRASQGAPQNWLVTRRMSFSCSPSQFSKRTPTNYHIRIFDVSWSWYASFVGVFRICFLFGFRCIGWPSLLNGSLFSFQVQLPGNCLYTFLKYFSFSIIYISCFNDMLYQLVFFVFYLGPDAFFTECICHLQDISQ